MRTLSIDIETYSSVDLAKSGVYAYSEAPDFQILLFAYSWDNGPVEVVDLSSGDLYDLPTEVVFALADPEIKKTAWNAAFERICISRAYQEIGWKGKFLDPAQWHCTMVHSLMCGYPAALAAAGKALNLEDQKMDTGKNLIRYFCVPCKPTKINKGRTRNLSTHAPEKWAEFVEYNRRDVEVELEALGLLKQILPIIPKVERELWILDQQINDRGINIDQSMVRHAIQCDSEYKVRFETEAINLTGLENPKSVAQIKKWLESAEGITVESLNKKALPGVLEQVETDKGKRVLELRQELSKTSVKKYEAMRNGMGIDERVRGLLQYYGANRTGRWAGRLVQVQNLPQNKMPDLDFARNLLKNGQYEGLGLIYDSVPDVLSQLIRTAFIPSENSRFIVADFSAIEARVIAWLANEQWRQEVFQTHGKIYEASAAQMFGVPLDLIKKGNPEYDLRAKGKVAELALGYQGGSGALIAMGALDMGLAESELPPLVRAWRKANPNIVRMWELYESTALEVVRTGKESSTPEGVRFKREKGFMQIQLPSGRSLYYINPMIEPHQKFDKGVSLTYLGMDQTTKQWKRIPTYGGKLVENVVQAIARDCLADSMRRLNDAGYKTVMHVHDEVVLDVPKGFGSLEEVSEIMAQPISWAAGLPLRADAYECDYYMKD